MKRPFRCQNPKCSEDPQGRLIFDFWSEERVCPKCGADARAPNSRYRHVVIPLNIIHYDPPDDIVEGKGKNVPACCPSEKIGSPRYKHASGNPLVVNCPACRETKVWRDNAELWGEEGDVLPSHDFVHVVNPSGKVTKGKPQEGE